jgi:8-oxo-dGTP pyrophosphatase MutT (NUDIX family)
MHRRALQDLLLAYRRDHPAEAALVDRFRAFVADHPDCLLRSCRPGHVTASAWILSADGDRCLLTHHRKLRKWLQLGGHVDGEAEVWRAARREAEEESGIRHFALHPKLLDIDIHPIPAHGVEPAHLHYDVRFLLRAAPGQDLECSDESLELAWYKPDEVDALTTDDSVLRLRRKARDRSWPAGSSDGPGHRS